MPSTLDAHLHTSSRLAPVEALKMGRGSESPLALPRNHTDSEQASMSWNLHGHKQIITHFANKQTQQLYKLGKGRYDSLAHEPSGIKVYPLRQ